MLRKLELPYFILVQLWYVNDRIISSSADSIKKYFGKNKTISHIAPDFIKNECAYASLFGPKNHLKEIKDPQKILDELIKNTDDEYHNEIFIKYIKPKYIGRYYDDYGRNYLQGYNDNMWFVRKRDGNSDIYDDIFPFIGQDLTLYRRDEEINISVFNIIIPKNRKATAIIYTQ